MEQDYAEAIKKLVRQYYEHEITLDAYRRERKRLIDKMDLEFNGNEFIDRSVITQVPQN